MNYSKDKLKDLAKRIGLKDISQTSYFPKYFEIETIRACNAKCKMCPIWKHPEQYGVMEQALFDKIASEMSDYSSWINSVCLSRNGEPLLDKNLVQKIRILKSHGIKDVTFSTNASKLNKELSLELIASGLDDIRFSVDGATKKTFEKIRNGLNFEEVIENCLQFIHLRNQYGSKPKIRMRMVLQDDNRHEENKWKEFWIPKLSKNDIVYSKEMNTWGNQLKKSSKKKSQLYSDIPCISPWSTMIILYNGKVPLCGVDYENLYNLGDINKSNIKKIWNSENYENIRRMHSAGKRDEISLCLGCNIWDLEERKIYNSTK